MADHDIAQLKGKRGLTQAIATRATDPNFYSSLEYLPNPDRVLRKLGKQQEIYDDIVSDAHVVGELRSVRSGLLGFEWRIVPGGEDPASMRAYDLVEAYTDKQPSPGMQWYDIIWTMADAVFRGYSVHEIIWARHDRFLMPEMIVDRPQARFVYGTRNELRLLTKQNRLEGEELGAYKWLVTRHMASFSNPYGLAVFSSCFWPYIFKHSGFKYFAKFCEKYGLPWPIGKYPRGTSLDDQNKFADQLAQMVEDAVAVVPDDGSVEMVSVQSSAGSNLPQERLIDQCNKELSKAITSQTLATEIQGNGSRAASETHRERETTVNQSDRAIIESTFNQLFNWITELNIAGAKPPTFEFYEEAEPRVDMAQFLTAANGLVPLKKSEVYGRLELTPPDDDDDVLPVRSGAQKPPPDNPLNQPEFKRQPCPDCGGSHHYQQTDQAPAENDPIGDILEQAIEHSGEGFNTVIQPIDDLLKQADIDGLTMAEFKAKLEEIYPVLDNSAIGNQMRDAMLLSYLRGMDQVGE